MVKNPAETPILFLDELSRTAPTQTTSEQRQAIASILNGN